jgi:hypothetical protein
MIALNLPWKWLALAGVVLATVLAVTGLYAYGSHQLRQVVAEARQEARDARDAFWTARIAQANAAAEKVRADAAQAMAAADAAARAEIHALQSRLTAQEQANATLPNGDQCGIDADRLRLLRP